MGGLAIQMYCNLSVSKSQLKLPTAYRSDTRRAFVAMLGGICGGGGTNRRHKGDEARTHCDSMPGPTCRTLRAIAYNVQ